MIVAQTMIYHTGGDHANLSTTDAHNISIKTPQWYTKYD
jgi:hypothetical protein